MHIPSVFPFSRQNRRRQRSERLGRVAELIAAAFLMLKGYRVLARRARTPYGELDLIEAADRGAMRGALAMNAQINAGEAMPALPGRRERWDASEDHDY